MKLTPPAYFLADSERNPLPDLWKLADTASQPPTKEKPDGGLEYWWQLEKCSICGKLGCVMFRLETGYRCEDHR